MKLQRFMIFWGLKSLRNPHILKILLWPFESGLLHSFVFQFSNFLTYLDFSKLLGIFWERARLWFLKFSSVCYHLENQVCSPLTENKIGTSCKIARMIAGKLEKLSSKIWILEKLEAPQMNGRKELLKIVKKGWKTFKLDNP